MTHIEIKRNENLSIGLTIRRCVVCNSVNSIGDCADAKAVKANKKWFENEHKQCGERFKDEKLAVAREALGSAHVKNVICGFEYQADGVRFYTAITNQTNIPHRYSVKLWEDADGVRVGKCVCSAGAKNVLCRHLIRAAHLDTDMFGVPMRLETVSEYQAYKRAA